MLIVCPSCGTSYDVELASLQPGGRRVRCVRCRTVWLAEVSHADKLMAAADELAPVRRTVAAMADVVAEMAASEPWAEHGDAELGEAIGRLADEPEAEAPADEVLVDAPADDAAALEAGPDGADDAEAAVEVDAPPIAPVEFDDRPPVEIDAEPADAQAIEPPEDVETYAARRQRRATPQSRRWPLSNLQSGILALLILDGILVGWRDEFVRVLPQTASFYSMLHLPVNLRGLSFDGVTTTAEQHEGVPILVVGGSIVNTTSRLVDVPRLKFAVRNAANEEIYSWTAVPPRTSLPPGEAVSFRSRLASPPPEAHDVLVRFVTRQDIIGGTR
jgi:predicted Zn finger-like uncharacterized protein